MNTDSLKLNAYNYFNAIDFRDVMILLNGSFQTKIAIHKKCRKMNIIFFTVRCKCQVIHLRIDHTLLNPKELQKESLS